MSIKFWTKPICSSCILEVSTKAIQLATSDESLQFKAVKRVLKILSEEFSEHTMPVWLSNKIFWEISKITKNPDPFKIIKRKSNEIALKMAEKIKKHVYGSETFGEKFKRALSAAVTGNVIDFGTAKHEFDLNQLKDLYFEILRQGFSIDHSNYLLEMLKKKEKPNVLYIGDNAGEIAFDKILIEVFLENNAEVIFVVKDGSISNDATLEDAEHVKLTKLVKVITTGSNSLGVDFNNVSREFLEELKKSTFIIAKGQSNYECFTWFKNKVNKPVFLLLRVKCGPIAEHLGVIVGENVLKYNFEI